MTLEERVQRQVSRSLFMTCQWFTLKDFVENSNNNDDSKSMI